MAGMGKFGMAMVVAGGLAGIIGTGERVQAETLTIGAGHSLRAVFQEILPMFEKEYGVTVRVVYGPSQTLRRRIERGDPIDLFLAEAAEEVERLHRKGLTLNGGPRVYAQTSLVLVMSATSPATATSFHDALSNRAIRVALADPDSSALGKITDRTLTKLDPTYRNRLRLIHAQQADEVLRLVRTGEADVGIVYRVDAISGGQVWIIDEAPAGTPTPVQFGQAVVWTCREASRGVAEEFLDFIMSPRIQRLLLHYGFDAVPSNGARAGLTSSRENRVGAEQK